MNTTATIKRTLTDTIGNVESSLSATYDSTTKMMSTRADALNEGVSERLDQFEARMPELPKKVVAYNRVAAERAFAQVRRNNEMVIEAFRPVVKVADAGVRTVVGTTKWAVEQTAGSALTGVRTIVGQTRAQVKRTAGTLNEQAVEFVDEATERVVTAERAAERAALASMTKAELYQMAQDIDIDGRADMNKAQLIQAINDAG